MLLEPVNLEPTSLGDIFDDIRLVANACEVSECAEKLIVNLSERVENVRKRAATIPDRPSCFLTEWVDPPFCSGHWGPELLEIAGGYELLGRKRRPVARIEWQQVLVANPEIIVLALCGYDVTHTQEDYQLLRRFPGFDSLSAAQTGEIHLVNATAYFSRPGPRIVDSLEIIAGILHPTEFPEFVSQGMGGARVVRLGSPDQFFNR